MELVKAIKRVVVLSSVLGVACFGNISSIYAGGGPVFPFKVEKERDIGGHKGYFVTKHAEGKTYVNIGMETNPNDSIEITDVNVHGKNVYITVKRIQRPFKDMVTYDRSTLISFDDPSGAVKNVIEDVEWVYESE